MKVTEHIANAKSTLISFEILPPLKGAGIQSIYNTLDPLMDFKPPFINVTYHRSEFIFKKTAEGLFEKKIVRKRPGTAGICTAIHTKYKVDTVPHLICGGFSVDETEDLLIELNFLGINNVLLLRGDKMKSEEVFSSEKNGHQNAIDLVHQTVRMNKGIYLEEDLNNAVPTDFCIGVAGYPEKHYEAANMESDLNYLKAKVDAGANYIVTQMFFDNKKFFQFVKLCREKGITVPIIPGLKPITNKKQIANLPRIFNVDIPSELLIEFDKCNSDEDVKQVGIDWCINQCRELMKEKIPVIHFYTMSNSGPVKKIVENIYS
ncbi:MAG TPA: methylenetetrahydrofolate reductase [NAD(P)H] [Bacteroidetes bacterium]|nr:methylenetetrahydrofolate reductase [NAD(P)H] [Bacteroidota bacterium]